MDNGQSNNIGTGKSEPDLFHRSVKGGFWVSVMNVSQQILALGRLCILMRLLEVNDFGILGVALLTMSILSHFTTTGFRQALIQKKIDIEEYLGTAWTLGLIRGGVLFAGTYFLAPVASLWFKNPEATNVIRAIGITFILASLSNIGTVYLVKELDFKKQYFFQICGTISDVIVAIVVVIIYRSVWALVAGKLAGEFVRLVVSYIIHPYRPKIEFDTHKAKEMWGFGKWIFGSTILAFLVNEGDDIFVGTLLGTEMLGFYQTAYRISNLPSTETIKVIGSVTFPAYSKIQDDLQRLGQAFIKVMHFTAFISFPMAGMIFLFANDFTRIVPGDKWLPMVPVMQILAIRGMIRSMGASVSHVFSAVGHPELGTRLMVLKTVILFVLIYPLTVKWGILGAAMAVTINSLMIFPLALYVSFRLLRFNIWKMLKVMILPLVSVLIMLAVMTLIRSYMVSETSIIEFTLHIVIAAGVFLSTVFLFDVLFKYGIRDIIREQLRAFMK